MTTTPNYGRPQSSTEQIAIAYVTKHPDRFVFPLATGKKGRPCIKDNLNCASNDPQQIKEWSRRFPGCNWGCATKKSGLVCVDIDSGANKHGGESVEALRAAGFALPKTETQRSPSGGYHCIYKGEHHFSASKIGLHIDTPNYFVIAGCKRDDGGEYKMHRDIAVQPLPEWVAEKIKPRADRPRAEAVGDPVPLDDFKKMLAATPYTGGPSGLDDRRTYQGWLSFAMTCHEAAGGDEADYMYAFIDWCLADPEGKATWTAESIERHWQSFTADPPQGQAAVTRASWFRILDATEHGELVPSNAADDFAGDAAPDIVAANDNIAAGLDAASVIEFKPTLFTDPNPKTIPPRDWLYALHYIRRFVVADVAPGGTVKTSNALVEAVVMASGADLLNVGEARMPRQPLKVWYWSGEDTKEEIDRRVSAIIKHYTEEDDLGSVSLKPETRALVKTNLFTDTGRDVPIKIAKETNGAFSIASPTVNGLVEAIKQNQIDVIIIDPFIDSHSIGENDNTRIEAVVSTWRAVAERANCCVCLVHHTRKGKPGGVMEYSAADARGATALVDAARDVRVFNVMTPEEADTYHVRKSECWRHIRVESGKPNMAARGALSAWRQIVSVDLGNARDGRPSDNVGVVALWEPPQKDPLADAVLHEKILDAARKLYDEGVRITSTSGRNRIAEMVDQFRAITEIDTISKADIVAAFKKAEHSRPPTWRYQTGHGGHGGAGYYPVDKEDAK